MYRKARNDFTGKVCGCLQVIERDFSRKRNTTLWRCVCTNCSSIVIAPPQRLYSNPKSCKTCRFDYRVYSDIELPCNNCGKTVITKSNRFAAYCSEECKANTRRNRGAENRRKTIESTLKALFYQIRSRSKKSGREFNLTYEWLLNKLVEQDGKCSHTGYKLMPSRQDMSGLRGTAKDTISVDRIDSNKGYTKDNVELVCYHYNLAKSKFTKEEFLQLCKDVITNSESAAAEARVDSYD